MGIIKKNAPRAYYTPVCVAHEFFQWNRRSEISHACPCMYKNKDAAYKDLVSLRKKRIIIARAACIKKKTDMLSYIIIICGSGIRFKFTLDVAGQAYIYIYIKIQGRSRKAVANIHFNELDIYIKYSSRMLYISTHSDQLWIKQTRFIFVTRTSQKYQMI